jgi:ribulose 1,5-bisphosphate synthetase/thiazole synthase
MTAPNETLREKRGDRVEDKSQEGCECDVLVVGSGCAGLSAAGNDMASIKAAIIPVQGSRSARR